MIEKIDGIVLRTLKYNDSLMIADMYTRQHGRLQFLVPVSRSKRSKVRSTLFQPLSMLSCTAAIKKSKSLSRVSDALPYAIYSSISTDVVKSSIAMFLSEVLTHALHEGGEDESLFVFLCRSFMLFDTLETGYADFHLVFMVQLLHYLGIYPNLEDAAPNCYFDLLHGCATNVLPAHPNYVAPENAGRFMALLKTDYVTMHQLVLNRALRGEYLAMLVSYYRLHVSEFPALKSMEVFRVLFD